MTIEEPTLRVVLASVPMSSGAMSAAVRCPTNRAENPAPGRPGALAAASANCGARTESDHEQTEVDGEPDAQHGHVAK
jgi:hypothetical protein